MKNLLVFSSLIILFFSCKNETANNENYDGKLSASLVKNPNSLDSNATPIEIGTLAFADTIHNFGTIKEGEIVEYNFDFKNTGNSDVIISNAHGSCGCTVPDYPKQPIKPNETAQIKVTFNSQGKSGQNKKSVQLFTNAKPAEYFLYIEANVEK